MSTRLVIFIIGGLIFGGILAGLLYYANARQKTTDSANQQEITELPTLTPPLAEPVVYQHESGFSFQHPEGSTVTENELDDAAYADVTLTSERESGSIEIDIVDTKLKDLAAWKKQNKVASDSMKTAEAELADLPAFEEQLNSGRKTLTAIEQGTLYTIVLDPGENFEYWDEIYQLLVSSFAFELPAEEETDSGPASSGGGSAGGDIIFEGEEIIE